MVPSSFEILRTELIDEIDRRSTIFKFDNILHEDIPLKIVQMEHQIGDLKDGMKLFDDILKQLKEDIPLIITQFKNELLKAFVSL